MTDYIENRPFDEIKIGDPASLRHTLHKISRKASSAMALIYARNKAKQLLKS